MKLSENENRLEFVRLATKYLPSKFSSLLSEDDTFMHAFLAATEGVQGLWYEGLDLDTMVALYQAHVLAFEGGYSYTLRIPGKGELGYAELWSILLKHEEKIFLDEEDLGCLFDFCNEDDPRYAEVLEKVFKRVYSTPSRIITSLSMPRLRSTELLLQLFAGCKCSFREWFDASFVAYKNRQPISEDGDKDSVLWDLIYKFCLDRVLKQV